MGNRLARNSPPGDTSTHVGAIAIDSEPMNPPRAPYGPPRRDPQLQPSYQHSDRDTREFSVGVWPASLKTSNVQRGAQLNVVRSLASAGGHGCPEDVRERTPQLLSFRNFPKTGSDGLVPPLLSPGGHAHFEPARGRQKNRPVPATPLPLARVPGSSEARAISLYQARIVSER